MVFDIQSHEWKTTVDDNVMLNWWKYAENKFKSFCIAYIFWITSLEICIYILTYLLFKKRLVLAISNQYCVAYFLFFIECISICFNEEIFCLLQGFESYVALLKRLIIGSPELYYSGKKLRIPFQLLHVIKKILWSTIINLKLNEKNCRWWPKTFLSLPSQLNFEY